MASSVFVSISVTEVSPLWRVVARLCSVGSDAEHIDRLRQLDRRGMRRDRGDETKLGVDDIVVMMRAVVGLQRRIPCRLPDQNVSEIVSKTETEMLNFAITAPGNGSKMAKFGSQSL